MSNKRINHHIAGPGVESEDVFRGSPRGNYGHVRNSADVQRGPALVRVAVNEIIHKWDERSALPTGGYVGGAEVTDCCYPGPRSNDGWLANLQSGGNAPRSEKPGGCPWW